MQGGNGTYLDRIVAAKRAEIARLRSQGYFSEMRRRRVEVARIRDLTRALRPDAPRSGLPGGHAAGLRPGLRKLSANAFPARGADRTPGRVGVIAEIKRASPSRGVLNPGLDPAATARVYAENGASAISVLTERDFFQGDIAFLNQVREAVPVPVLRKDFILEADQVFESRAMGADAILLIAAILSPARLAMLLEMAESLGLQCLVEVHDEAELDRTLAAGATLVGINNRNLCTFEISLDVTRRLAPLVPPECTLVAESGICTRDDVERLAGCGAHAVLVGEALVRAGDMAAKVRELAGVERGSPEAAGGRG